MIHIIEVSKNLLDVINAPQNRYPSSTEVNGEFYFVDGDEIVFMSGRDTSKKFEVLSYKNDNDRTYVEFY